VRALAREAAALLGTQIPAPDPVVLDGWIGPGYGRPSPEGQAAARLMAATEGIFLDQTFGAKAMAALIAECRTSRTRGTRVFLVSGGVPSLFAGPGDEAP
jgi:D-cysteine desulfhydrase